MLLELLLALIIGILFGIVTGLTPGVHINLISILLLSISPFLNQYFSLLSLASFIIGMSVTHTFIDSIPSIFLGAPDSSTALGVLPGHRLLLAGEGLKAVKLTIMGSLGALILSIIFFPTFCLIIKYFYPYLKTAMPYLLLTTIFFMILREKKKWLTALLIFLLSGTLGLLVLNNPVFKQPLFPMLSGLFGVSTLLISLKDENEIPEQKTISDLFIEKIVAIKAIVSAQLSGFITAMMPGLGSATAAIISLQFTRDLGDEGYLILQGGINTVNFLLSLSTLLIIQKARNGSVIAIQKLIEQISVQEILLLIFLALFAGGLASILALFIGKKFSVLITKVNYSLLIKLIIFFLLVLTIFLSGVLGLLVLITATAIGLFTINSGVARVHAMACILLPVTIYFLF